GRSRRSTATGTSRGTTRRSPATSASATSPGPSSRHSRSTWNPAPRRSSTAEDGTAEATVTVRAPVVVVAAGSLESPGVLLRSGIGGPAVGQYLRLHPCTCTTGDYGTDLQAW